MGDVADITKLKKKIIFKLSLVEKPYFYSDGKIHRTQSFTGGKKVLLKTFSGDDVGDIAVAINKLHANGEEVFVLVDSVGHLWKETGADGKGIIIKALVL